MRANLSETNSFWLTTRVTIQYQAKRISLDWTTTELKLCGCIFGDVCGVLGDSTVSGVTVLYIII